MRGALILQVMALAALTFIGAQLSLLYLQLPSLTPILTTLKSSSASSTSSSASIVLPRGSDKHGAPISKLAAKIRANAAKDSVPSDSSSSVSEEDKHISSKGHQEEGYDKEAAYADGYSVSDRVHAFYYPWYGAPAIDGDWQHWNHELMPHWNSAVTNRYPKGKHQPPLDIGANYFPLLGPYSSLNASVVETHFKWFRRAGIGVCVVSWYPPDSADPAQEASIEHSDKVVPLLLTTAEKLGIKIAFHIEPYHGRSATSVARDLKYISEKYGASPSFYRSRHHGNRPVVYVYDSYHIGAGEWATILSPSGSNTIRGSEYDAVMLALWVIGDQPTRGTGIESFVRSSGFDGAYTYFAGSKFAWGSNPSNWKRIRQLTRKAGMLFSPSVGPGYIDTRVRPWNGANTISRSQGRHYDSVFKEAVGTCPDFISITSFNEWHEGTQIEPAMSLQDLEALRLAEARQDRTSLPKGWNSLEGYYDYLPEGTFAYLDKTREWVAKFDNGRCHESSN